MPESDGDRCGRLETVHPRFDRLVCGYYQEGPSYATWRTHGTRDWLLIYTQVGAGRFAHRNGAFVAHPGELTLLAPGVTHDYRTDACAPVWTLIWAHFHPREHWLPWLNWPEETTGLMRLRLPTEEAMARVSEQFLDAYRASLGVGRRAQDFAMLALEEMLLLCDAFNPRSTEAHVDARIQAALDVIARNLNQELSLTSLADSCGLSLSRFSHLFREQIGLAPMRYLEIQRLERARQLLEHTQRSIQAISGEVGFASPLYFAMRFKQHTGFSPRAYRNQR